MSKLSDAVKHNNKKSYKPQTEFFNSVVKVNEVIETITPTQAILYKIEARIGREILIQDNLASKNEQDMLEEAVKKVKRQVIEAVFGEFREDIYLVYQSLWEWNCREAEDRLRKLEQKMFDF
jgi:hypothetical protein